MTIVAVSIAGAAGAVCRYLISGWVQNAVRSDFPAGTLTVNLSGSFALGLIVGTGPLDSTLILFAVGFLGGFTTFSTWMIETVRLGHRSLRTLLNLVVSLVGGLAVAAVGFTLTN
jgi:fluoride exporter